MRAVQMNTNLCKMLVTKRLESLSFCFHWDCAVKSNNKSTCPDCQNQQLQNSKESAIHLLLLAAAQQSVKIFIKWINS